MKWPATAGAALAKLLHEAVRDCSGRTANQRWPVRLPGGVTGPEMAVVGGDLSTKSLEVQLDTSMGYYHVDSFVYSWKALEYN